MHKHIPGAARQGPYWWGWPTGAYERIETVMALMDARQLPAPTLVVLNCLWWDMARLVSYVHKAKPTLLTRELVHQYSKDLAALIKFVQTTLTYGHLVLHTAAARAQHGRDGVLSNSVAGQLNSALRIVAQQTDVKVIDLAQHVTGIPAAVVLRDYLHPQPWVSVHLFRQYLQCI